MKRSFLILFMLIGTLGGGSVFAATQLSSDPLSCSRAGPDSPYLGSSVGSFEFRSLCNADAVKAMDANTFMTNFAQIADPEFPKSFYSHLSPDEQESFWGELKGKIQSFPDPAVKKSWETAVDLVEKQKPTVLKDASSFRSRANAHVVNSLPDDKLDLYVRHFFIADHFLDNFFHYLSPSEGKDLLKALEKREASIDPLLRGSYRNQVDRINAEIADLETRISQFKNRVNLDKIKIGDDAVFEQFVQKFFLADVFKPAFTSFLTKDEQKALLNTIEAKCNDVKMKDDLKQKVMQRIKELRNVPGKKAPNVPFTPNGDVSGDIRKDFLKFLEGMSDQEFVDKIRNGFEMSKEDRDVLRTALQPPLA